MWSDDHIMSRGCSQITQGASVLYVPVIWEHPVDLIQSIRLRYCSNNVYFLDFLCDNEMVRLQEQENVCLPIVGVSQNNKPRQVNSIYIWADVEGSQQHVRPRNLCNWAASSETIPLNMLNMRRFRSPCTCAKYHPGLCFPFVHSVVPNDYVTG